MANHLRRTYLGYSPTLSFAIADVPDNVLIDSKGRIVARSMDGKQLEERISNLLK